VCVCVCVCVCIRIIIYVYVYTGGSLLARECIMHIERLYYMCARAQECAREHLNEKPKYTGRRVGITPIGGYLSDKQECTRAGRRALALTLAGYAGVEVGYTRCVTRGEW